MLEALIGIIVLQVVVFAVCVCVAVRVYLNSQERAGDLLMRSLTAERLAASNERQWWQHQVEVALNRHQFPDIAAMQTASSAPDTPEPAETAYVDERREFELQEQ